MDEDLELQEVLDRWLDAKLESVHTCVPAKVVSYAGHGTRLAKVQPLVSLLTNTGASVDLPPLDNVPVVFPSTSNASIVFPLQEGDCVLLMFSESGIGNFLASDGARQVRADEQSRFSLTDAIAVPGLWPAGGKQQQGLPESGLVVQFGDSVVHLQEDGTISLKASGSGKLELMNELSGLKAQIDALWDALIQQTTDTATWMTAAAALGGAPVPGSAFSAPLATEQARLITENTTKAQVGNLLQ